MALVGSGAEMPVGVLHVGIASAGSVENSIRPASSTATHKVVVGQEMPVIASPPRSIPDVAVQAGTAAVGFVETRTLSSSITAHMLVPTHEIARSAAVPSTSWALQTGAGLRG